MLAAAGVYASKTDMKKISKNNKKPITFHIISLFPEALSSYIESSLIARAQREGRIAIVSYNPRFFVKPTKAQAQNEKPYLRIDDKPYGGGPGMVMQAEPVIKAIAKAMTGIKKRKGKAVIAFFDPMGEQFTNETADTWAQKVTDIVLVCGRYEGIDARVKKVFKMVPITVGPYILTGGELPALIVIDTVARRIPGVLGNIQSLEELRAASSDVYTRPEVLKYKGKKLAVPKVLLSGNHADIEAWRLAQRTLPKKDNSQK